MQAYDLKILDEVGEDDSSDGKEQMTSDNLVDSLFRPESNCVCWKDFRNTASMGHLDAKSINSTLYPCQAHQWMK